MEEVEEDEDEVESRVAAAARCTRLSKFRGILSLRINSKKFLKKMNFTAPILRYLVYD